MSGDNGASTSSASTHAAGLSATPLSAEPGHVVYQVLVRSFWDGWWSGDGTGDFAGVVAKLDYLTDLGVDTLMLMPVYPSTGGMGYIPTDLFDVDPAYGHQEDFAAMVDAAHARGMRVILDTPFNHIADSSAWFTRARQKDCEGGSDASPYCRYFFFTPTPPTTAPFENWHVPWDWNDTTTANVFQFPWGYDATKDRNEQYYATFSPQMPDLAYWDFANDTFNQPVVDEIYRFFAQWGAAGVDGYRVDAAKHLVEGPDSNIPPSTPHNLELLRGFLANARTVNPGTSFVAEVYSGTDEIETYLPDATDMALDFPYMYAIRDGVQGGENQGDELRQLLQHYEATQDTLGRGHHLVFAGNHDVPRLWTLLNGDEGKIRLAHFLAFMAPEPVSLFYGEEVGMAGDVIRANLEANPPIPSDVVDTVRAFPWDGASPAVGFPNGTLPVMTAPDNYAQNNYATMVNDPSSLFNYVKSMIALRKTFPLTATTRITVSSDLFGSMLGYTMVTNDNGTTRCRTVVANLSADGPWTMPIAHLDPTCGASRDALLENATAAAPGQYTVSCLTQLPTIKPQVFFSVPSHWEKLAISAMHEPTPEARLAKFKATTGGNIRFALSGGAGLKREVKDFFYACGLTMIEGYGLTETSPTLTMNQPASFRFDTVGKAFPSVELKLAEDGEILAKGPNVFGGYHKDPEATKQCFTEDGWFMTGDVGRWTEDGFLQIIDRKKDILVTAGGKNVPPTNIEMRFRDDPVISQVVVYGEAKKFLVAGVWLNEAVAPKDEAARQALVQDKIEAANKNLASYESIKKFVIMQEPLTVEGELLTASLKIRRKKIYERFKDTFEGLYEDTRGGDAKKPTPTASA